MKKRSFVDGAIISTLCLILCKILGLIYVIPFYRIIGTQGGALYSYAYSIYAVFLNLSTVGIPAAIAKIICEYDTLNYQNLKHRSYKLASNLLNYIGIFSFIIMFIFAKFIAISIIGGVEGGNSVEDVATAIRIISLALLVVPRLSILKGYFQGNKYITQSSLSTIIEQLVRVLIIIVGSYVTVKILHMPVNYAVYFATFAATAGAFSAYLYLKIKEKKYKNKIEDISSKKVTKEILKYESKVTTKTLLKKIIFYAIPFVLMSIVQSAYNVVDTFTVVRTLTSLGYSTQVAEATIGVISTWAQKLNMIILSMSIGMTSSLIPSIVSSYTKKDFEDINDKINLSFKMLLFITIPMAFGMSFLSSQIWHIFYEVNPICSNIFKFYILQVIIHGLFTTSTTITQSMNQTKITIGALITSFLLKATLNIPLMYLFKTLGIPAYYAPTLGDATAKLIALFGVLFVLKKKYNFKYKSIFVYLIKVSVALIAMLGVLSLLKYVYFANTSIITAIITVATYASIGAVIYLVITNKFKLLEEILGSDYKDKILKKLKIKK